MKRSNPFLYLLLFTFTLVGCGDSTVEKSKDPKNLAPLVKAEKVQRKNFTHEIRIQGNVETDKDILINSEMGGLITSVLVKEGQRVRQGQTIATIDAAILASNIDEIKTQLEYAEYVLGKQEELNKRGVGSEFELEAARNQVEALKSKLKSISTQKGKSVIKAPFSGTIDQVFAKSGQMSGPQSPVARLVNNKEVDIIGSLSEKHIANVKIGTPLRVTFPNYLDTVINLSITNVGNYIEPLNRTFRIMSTVKNNAFLLPNMLAEISITDLEVSDGLVIPSASVLKDQDNNDFVYVLAHKSKGFKATKLSVEVIEKYNGEALIKDNDALKPSTMVVVEGARGITSGDIVRTK